MFIERLEKYRNELHLKKVEMADKLQVSESYYSLIENDKRKPSKHLIEKLASISELPEEYWMYGINKKDYLDASQNFKNLRKTLNTIFEIGSIESFNEVFDENNNPKDSLGRLIIAALKADINFMIDKS